MSAVNLGQVIGGKYRVIRLLGSGGMGAVYEAENPEIQQRVALKILTVDIQKNPGLGQRFLNEARAANQIKHPGVAKVHDFGILDTGIVPWMAIEYLEGESLASRLEAALRLPGNRLGEGSWWMIGELASILDAAHAQGIVHRDLKPANVMLVPDPRASQGEHIKLLDFGIAKLRGDDLTKSGVLLGTPVYMAPEQFRAAAEVDGKADVYSLGAIAFQLLSGRLPFEVKGTYELMAAKCFDFPTPIEKYAPTLAAEMQAFVMRMLERDPAVRPTAFEVESEVRRTLGLPAPRQTGGHNPTVIPTPPNQPPSYTNHPTGDDSDDEETPSLSSKASAAVQAAMGPTPSEQRAVGELEPSPRAANVPISLSSIPSVPMTFTPSRRPEPSDSTAKGLKGPGVAAAVAALAAIDAPSEPTRRDTPRRRPIYFLSAVLAVAAGISAAIAWWPHEPATPTPIATPATGHAPPGPTPTPAPTPAPTAPQPEPTVPLATPTAPPLLPTPQPPVDPANSNPSAGHVIEHKAPHERVCVPQVPVESCIITDMTNAQRERVLSAIRRSGVKWCHGERLILSGFPHYAQITMAPPSLNPESAQAYKLTGLLGEAELPSQVEIKCRGK